LRDTAEVLAGAVNFLCERDDASWRALAREATEGFPDHKLLKKRAAEAVLDEVLSLKRFEIGGQLASDITLADIRKATTVLQGLWDETRASEPRRGETALPQNLARVLWALNESAAASAVLD
jgi:hypothetical protein